MVDLHLHLCFRYYDAVERGEKKEEYRIASRWIKRLQGKQFNNVVLWRGYTKTKITRPYTGYVLKVMTHEHFGPNPVEICAIPV